MIKTLFSPVHIRNRYETKLLYSLKLDLEHTHTQMSVNCVDHVAGIETDPFGGRGMWWSHASQVVRSVMFCSNLRYDRDVRRSVDGMRQMR